MSDRCGQTGLTFHFRPADAEPPTADLLVLPLHSDLPAALGRYGLDPQFTAEVLEELGRTGFHGGPGEQLTLPTWGRIPARRLCLVGVPPTKGMAPADWCSSLRPVAEALLDDASVVLRVPATSAPDEAIRGTVETLLLVGASAQGPLAGRSATVTLVAADLPSARAESAISRGRICAEETLWAAALTALPANVATAEELSRRIASRCEQAGLDVRVWNEQQLRRSGFGGLLAVNAGSAVPPRLVELRYRGAPAPDVALTGKGVTFDAGGLCLKTPEQMLGMHKDMAGAASVAAAAVAAARLGLSLSLHVAVPLVENVPGPGCLRPGDVISHYGGRTTEVVHTDAEGRLVVADTLAYLAEHEPDYLIDLATIGNLHVALGPDLWGAVASDDGLVSALLAAGEQAGEPGWRLPLWPGYARLLESQAADSRNIGAADGAGGALTSALFLHPFTAGRPWAHLDIAGPAMATAAGRTAHQPTLAPTRTLIRFLESLSTSPLVVNEARPASDSLSSLDDESQVTTAEARATQLQRSPG